MLACANALVPRLEVETMKDMRRPSLIPTFKDTEGADDEQP